MSLICGAIPSRHSRESVCRRRQSASTAFPATAQSGSSAPKGSGRPAALSLAGITRHVERARARAHQRLSVEEPRGARTREASGRRRDPALGLDRPRRRPARQQPGRPAWRGSSRHRAPESARLELAGSKAISQMLEQYRANTDLRPGDPAGSRGATSPWGEEAGRPDAAHGPPDIDKGCGAHLAWRPLQSDRLLT